MERATVTLETERAKCGPTLDDDGDDDDLCFIRTFMSDAILSDCPSAVICRTATKFNGILAARFNLYCHINNICL
jgi:hypothetical protein